MDGLCPLESPGKQAATMLLLLLQCRKQSKLLSGALCLIQMLKLHYYCGHIVWKHRQMVAIFK